MRQVRGDDVTTPLRVKRNFFISLILCRYQVLLDSSAYDASSQGITLNFHFG